VLRRVLFRVYKGAAKLIFGSSLARHYPAHPLPQALPRFDQARCDYGPGTQDVSGPR